MRPDARPYHLPLPRSRASTGTAAEDEVDAYCREALRERGMELIEVAGPAIQKAAAEFADGVTENIEAVLAAAD